MSDGDAQGCSDPIDVASLVAEHHASLYAYAVRLCGGPDGAEDLVQQTFLKAHANRDQLRDPDRAAPWLFAILRNCFLKAVRKKTPVRAGDLGIELETSVEEIPEVEEFDRERLEMALAELSEEFRVVVVMYYFEGASYREIAEGLGLPPGTVMSRLSRAKSHLRRRLSNRPTDGKQVTDIPPPASAAAPMRRFTASNRESPGWSI